MNIVAIRLFSLKEKVIFICGVFLTKLIQLLPNFYELLAEKAHFDRLIISGLKLQKNDCLHYSIEYEDSQLGSLKILLRRKSSDYFVFNQVLENKSYQCVIDIFKRHFKTANTIVDAGGNIGLATLFFSKSFPNAKIISIEPDVENFNVIKSNVMYNQISPILYNNALWTEITELSLNNDFRDGESWSLRVSKEIVPRSNLVKSITLDEIIKLNELEIIDILKIDIEGAEFKLFEDIKFIELVKNKVRIIAMEIHEDISAKEKILNCLLDYEIHLSGETFICLNKNLILKTN